MEALFLWVAMTAGMSGVLLLSFNIICVCHLWSQIIAETVYAAKGCDGVGLRKTARILISTYSKCYVIDTNFK